MDGGVRKVQQSHRIMVGLVFCLLFGWQESEAVVFEYGRDSDEQAWVRVFVKLATVRFLKVS